MCVCVQARMRHFISYIMASTSYQAEVWASYFELLFPNTINNLIRMGSFRDVLFWLFLVSIK